MKIAICLPTNRGLRPKTLESLLKLIAHSKLEYEVLISTKGFNTAENRTWLAAQAVKRNCTHTFWVDDDMIYPEDTLERLLAHDKDIVGAKYANRRGDGEVIEYFGDPLTGMFKCKALGGGCVLVRSDVFRKIKQPWFWYVINPNGAIIMSNDWYFCKKARESGYDIWCDSALKVGHISEHEY